MRDLRARAMDGSTKHFMGLTGEDKDSKSGKKIIQGTGIGRHCCFGQGFGRHGPTHGQGRTTT